MTANLFCYIFSVMLNTCIIAQKNKMVPAPYAPKKTQRSFESHALSIGEKAIRTCLFPSSPEINKGVSFCPTLDIPPANKRSFMRLYLKRRPTWETRRVNTPGAPLKKKFVEPRTELNPQRFKDVVQRLSF